MYFKMSQHDKRLHPVPEDTVDAESQHDLQEDILQLIEILKR